MMKFRAPLALMLLSSAAAIAQGPADDVAVGTLVITERLEPGNSSETAELTLGATTVHSTVHRWQNPPTGDSGSKGDFRSLYLVLAGQPHPRPESLTAGDALVESFKSLAFEIREVRSEKLDDGWGKTRHFEIKRSPHPRQASPAIAFASALTDDDRPRIRLVSVTQRPEQRTSVVETNGQRRLIEHIVFVPMTEEHLFDLSQDGVRVFTTDGKQLEAKTAVRRLQRESPVVVSQREPVDPRYRAALRSDALNVVLPGVAEDAIAPQGTIPPPPRPGPPAPR